MIYALEWYDLPRKDHGYLVEYHPYLTQGDQARLDQINSEHFMQQGVTFALLSIISNRFLLNRKSKFFSKYMQQRWLRGPCALAQAGILTYGLNITVMRAVYMKDLEDLKLTKYFDLDLDADMMREDLKQMGINVEAKFYDHEKAQERARENNKNI